MDPYRGLEFELDCTPSDAIWRSQPLSYRGVAEGLANREVVAWVQGRCEIGPRALGNRSLLASASLAASHEILNTIKERESYRPIAPACLADAYGDLFTGGRADSYMLYFSRVRDRSAIPAVTHADGTARVHLVRPQDNPPFDGLLRAIENQSGLGACAIRRSTILAVASSTG